MVYFAYYWLYFSIKTFATSKAEKKVGRVHILFIDNDALLKQLFSSGHSLIKQVYLRLNWLLRTYVTAEIQPLFI